MGSEWFVKQKVDWGMEGVENWQKCAHIYGWPLKINRWLILLLFVDLNILFLAYISLAVY